MAQVEACGFKRRFPCNLPKFCIMVCRDCDGARFGLIISCNFFKYIKRCFLVETGSTRLFRFWGQNYHFLPLRSQSGEKQDMLVFVDSPSCTNLSCLLCGATMSDLATHWLIDQSFSLHMSLGSLEEMRRNGMVAWGMSGV